MLLARKSRMLQLAFSYFLILFMGLSRQFPCSPTLEIWSYSSDDNTVALKYVHRVLNLSPLKDRDSSPAPSVAGLGDFLLMSGIRQRDGADLRGLLPPSSLWVTPSREVSSPWRDPRGEGLEPPANSPLGSGSPAPWGPSGDSIPDPHLDSSVPPGTSKARTARPSCS